MEREEERKRVRQQGGEISRKRGMGGGIKLALGHLMTNNGTAPHHCRKPARKQGGNSEEVIALALVFPPLAFLSLIILYCVK